MVSRKQENLFRRVSYSAQCQVRLILRISVLIQIRYSHSVRNSLKVCIYKVTGKTGLFDTHCVRFTPVRVLLILSLLLIQSHYHRDILIRLTNSTSKLEKFYPQLITKAHWQCFTEEFFKYDNGYISKNCPSFECHRNMGG